MARLPVPGSDDGIWGTLLNDYLSQAHNTDGSLKAGSADAGVISDGAISTAKLDGTLTGAVSKAQSSVQQVNGATPDIGGSVTLTAGDVGAAAAVHSHAIADVTNLQADLDAIDANANNVCTALGAVAWTIDPEVATFSATQANTHLGAVYLPKDQIITALSLPVITAGAGLTLGILAIYDGNANLVAQTPNSPTVFQSTGWKTVNLTTPYQVPVSGLYYLASGWLGTTLPAVLNIQHTSAVSQGFPSGKPRGIHAAVPTGTSLPDPAISTGNYTNFPLIVAL